MFLADMYGVDRRDTVQRLTAFADRVNMTPFLDRLCETYSHGMKQKIALAGALVHDPTLLIVDEPMVGLDPRTTRIIKDVFRELAAVGATIFMSTHTLDVAETIADRIAILNQGRIVGLGTLDELRQKASTDGRLEDVFLRLTAEAETEPLETRPAKALTQSEPRQ
jgi:ABC-2 type transport system ATP-binding protein